MGMGIGEEQEAIFKQAPTTVTHMAYSGGYVSGCCYLSFQHDI
jgi:hypothetical protein